MPSSKFNIERKCAICGKTFLAKTIYSQYCSHNCSCKAHDKKVREEREEQKRAELAAAIPPNRQYISITEATLLYKVSRDTIYRLVRRGIVPSIKLGPKSIRLDREALQFVLGNINVSPPPITAGDITSDNSYNITEITAKFRISAKTVYKAIKDNNIPTKQIGRYVYAPMELINKLFT